MRNHLGRAWIILLVAGGCQDSQGDGAGAQKGSAGDALMSDVKLLDPGSACSQGGVAITRGVDQDHDGKLQPAEVVAVQNVCSSANANANANDKKGTLILLSTVVPAGMTCSAGGRLFTWCNDADAD